MIAGLCRWVLQVYGDLTIGVSVYESNDNPCFRHPGAYLVVTQQTVQEVAIYPEKLISVLVVFSHDPTSGSDPITGWCLGRTVVGFVTGVLGGISAPLRGGQGALPRRLGRRFALGPQVRARTISPGRR